MSWKTIRKIDAHVHILPGLVNLFGIGQTNRILRMFGTERLIFGTDYPEKDYDLYCSLLDQMDFLAEEKEKIAYGNISVILQLEK